MPEEKKQSFTFSDKIKSSKNAPSKSFANRISSKVGSDGKPRQTLLERTKRDAPFFIAALVALLLLPFLYKYSGNVSEEPAFITPGYEDAMLNPDRSGFAISGDPDGQIAQLSGRDSLSLIRPFGSATAEEEADDYDYRNAYEGEGSSSKTEEMDTEENTTNIYKYRKNAAPATRAAFRRAATKIGRLGNAGRAGAAGNRLGVGMWGGGLKSAARRVRGGAAPSAPKPVSLQPLQSAGKPSRSYFGQGAAAEARRSKDAMGKANAMQALMDAQMKPVEPGKIGGLFGGDFGGPGGGVGNLKREFLFNGKEPWWWDMMKQRSQMEWERKFKWKTWRDELIQGILGNILTGLANCIITGNSDGDPDTFLGTGGGAATKDPKCCGLKEKQFAASYPDQYNAFPGNFEEACKAVRKNKLVNPEGKCVWEAGHGGGDTRLNGWQARWQCLGGVAATYTSGDTDLREATDCNNMVNKFYQVTPSGQARKWNTYIYVVARDYLPETVGKYLSQPRGHLCTEEDDNVKIGARTSTGVSASALPKRYDQESVFLAGRGKKRTDRAYSRKNEEQKLLANVYERHPEAITNGCVVYVQKGDTFNYKNFETNMVAHFAKLLENTSIPAAEREYAARKAFDQLDLMFVDSFSAKDKLARVSYTSTGDSINLPMVYWRFDDAFIRHKGVSADATTGKRSDVDKSKYRVEGVDLVHGDRCFFNNSVSINCEDVDGGASPKATVVFKQGFAGQASPTADTSAVRVSATFHGLAENADGARQPFNNPQVLEQAGNVIQYTLSHALSSTGTRIDNKDLVGNVFWTLERGGYVVDTASCSVNMSGDGASQSVDSKVCKNMQESEACCEEIGGGLYIWDTSKPEGQQCVSKGQEPDTEGMTRLAPVLSWVPSTPTRRTVVDGEPKQEHFAGDKLLKNAKDDMHCGSQTSITMDSAAAKQFVDEVIDAYNKENPSLPIAKKLKGGNFPTDGEFVDALMIASRTSGAPQTVSAAAVCELGRDMVRMSRDKHTGKMRVANPLTTPYGGGDRDKDENEVFHNELGAFLAYIHLESIFYPQKFFGSFNQCDYRFLVEKEESCTPQVDWKHTQCLQGGEKPCKEYHHNNYNNVPPGNGQAKANYKESLRLILAQAMYPLADLVKGQTFPAVGDSGGASKGKEYNEKISLLLHEGSDFQPWQGNACVAFEGSSHTLKVKDVLNYVTTACSVGLDFKPYGTPGSSSGSQEASGGPNKNTGTQGS